MSVDLKWYESDDSTEVDQSSALNFGSLQNGETGAAVSLHLWNGNGNPGATIARNLKISITVEDANGNQSQSELAAAQGWVEARIVGSAGSPEPLLTGWKPLGLYRYLDLGNLEAEQARYIEVRAKLPAGSLAAGGTAQLLGRVTLVYQQSAVGISDGFDAAGARGVRSGLGEGDVHCIVSGLTCSESSPVDSNVQVAAGAWIHKGLPYQILDSEVALDANDGDSVALASGKAYWATLSAGAGSITVTKSSQVDDPPDPSYRPSVPDGETLIAYVQRHYSPSTIADADIDQSTFKYGRFGLQTNGRVATVGTGRALSSGLLITYDGPVSVTLPASQTSLLYLLPTGGLAVVASGSDPSDLAAVPLWQVTTDASSVTAIVDLRPIISPRRLRIPFIFAGALSGTPTVYEAAVGDRDLLLDPTEPVEFHVEDAGTGSQGTIADVEYREPGGSWTTLFTSQGADDQRPTIAAAASEPYDDGALPEVLIIPAHSMLRATIDQVPDTTDSADGVLVLRGEAA